MGGGFTLHIRRNIMDSHETRDDRPAMAAWRTASASRLRFRCNNAQQTRLSHGLQQSLDLLYIYTEDEGSQTCFSSTKTEHDVLSTLQFDEKRAQTRFCWSTREMVVSAKCDCSIGREKYGSLQGAKKTLRLQPVVVPIA